jgi:hypothetical protein
MRTIRTLALVLGLLATGTATAGEVPWSYKVVDVNPPAPVLAQAAGVTDLEAVLYTFDPLVLPDPRLPDPASYWSDHYWEHIPGSGAHVRITDDASGDSAWRSVSWGATRRWERAPDRSTWLLTELIEDGYATADNPWQPYLGGNTYRIWVEDREVHVEVRPDSLPTNYEPEPGTLALAGIGLGAVGLVRRVRRGRPG